MPLTALESQTLRELVRDVWNGDGPLHPSLVARAAELESDMRDIKHDLYGNGQAGFMEETKKYINQQRGMWMVIIAIGLLLTILEGINTFRDHPRPTPSQHTELPYPMPERQ